MRFLAKELKIKNLGNLTIFVLTFEKRSPYSLVLMVWKI